MRLFSPSSNVGTLPLFENVDKTPQPLSSFLGDQVSGMACVGGGEKMENVTSGRGSVNTSPTPFIYALITSPQLRSCLITT